MMTVNVELVLRRHGIGIGPIASLSPYRDEVRKFVYRILPLPKLESAFQVQGLRLKLGEPLTEIEVQREH